MAAPKHDLGRRAPLQARGVRRVDAILAAANELLAEVGYDALTLTSVATRSGSNIASLYRFFANKDQLLDMLADRIASRLGGLTGTVLDASHPRLAVDAFVDHLVDQLGMVATEYPSLGEIMGRVEVRHQSIDAQITVRLEAIVAARAPLVPRSQASLIVAMTMAIVRGGLKLMAQAPKQRRRAVAAELKAALTSYLERRMSSGE